MRYNDRHLINFELYRDKSPLYEQLFGKFVSTFLVHTDEIP